MSRKALSPAHVAFGEAIQACRNDAGLSQERAAQESQVDRAYFGELERGQKNPGLTNIVRIARAIGVKPSQLLARAEELGLVDAKLPDPYTRGSRSQRRGAR